MKHINHLQLCILILLSGLDGIGQLALNNNGGTGLTLQIDNGLVVHSDGDVNNLTGATMAFESAGEPNLEFDGDFTNSTTATLTAGTGLLELTGSASQNLDFGGDDLYNLEINNAAGGVFTRSATVTNEVQFTTGDFTTTDSELLTFETGATAAGASDDSHVNGPVAKNFNSTTKFTFPVGHGSSYNSIAFTPDGTGATTMKATYNFSQPGNRKNKVVDICNVSNVESWDLARTAGTEDGVVTLEWDADSDVSNLTDLRVVYWDGSTWQSGGGTASGAAGSGTIPSGASMSTFNTFTLGSTPCDATNTLPVELVKFSADPVNDETVIIKWTTASEINNDYFVVERSKDGINFTPVDSLDAHGNGNSTDMQNYSYLDENPYSGVSYYRLRQVDKDGTTSYSNIENVNFEGLEIVSLFPNPTNGEININITSSEEETVQLKIYDAIGKLIKSEKFNLIEGNTQIESMLDGTIGKYYISIITSSGKYYDYSVVLIK